MYTFSEVQRFRVKWAWAAVIVFNGFFIYAIIQQIIFNTPFGSKPASDGTLLLMELIPLALLIFIISIKLNTCYDQNGIRFRYYPFQFRTTFIAWNELTAAYLRPYSSYYEYGGWGIRTGSLKTGKAINTSESCSTGLQLEFKDGRLLLIGTKNPGAIQKIIDEVITAGTMYRG
jgi:hypothetical protein